MTPTWQRLVWGRDPRRTIYRSVLVAILATVFFGFVLRPMRVQGISMYPTLTDGTLHWTNLLRYRVTDPKRGELVLIGIPGHRVRYLKRVLALPGETIAFREGKVYIDDRLLAELYIRDSQPWNMAPMQMGPDEYFVCGDNRTMPMENHRLGLVERRDILGGLVW